ncbi:helix-turn-helix domain-containing protein [Nocardia sp. NBC_00881]|uniref:helix-turn-helix domain-containing protein n=1 Tax=Nocardia sp. NBC_00881 TaxID=2975995 RepID=UPI0038682A23
MGDSGSVRGQRVQSGRIGRRPRPAPGSSGFQTRPAGLHPWVRRRGCTHEFGHQCTRLRTSTRGQRLGRPPAISDEQVCQARALLTRPDESVSSIARLLGVSRTTLYKYVPELTDGAQARIR